MVKLMFLGAGAALLGFCSTSVDAWGEKKDKVSHPGQILGVVFSPDCQLGVGFQFSGVPLAEKRLVWGCCPVVFFYDASMHHTSSRVTSRGHALSPAAAGISACRTCCSDAEAPRPWMHLRERKLALPVVGSSPCTRIAARDSRSIRPSTVR